MNKVKPVGPETRKGVYTVRVETEPGERERQRDGTCEKGHSENKFTIEKTTGMNFDGREVDRGIVGDKGKKKKPKKGIVYNVNDKRIKESRE